MPTVYFHKNPVVRGFIKHQTRKDCDMSQSNKKYNIFANNSNLRKLKHLINRF